MRIIIDTGVLFRPAALEKLAGCDAVVPAVVYLERVRQLRRDGRDIGELDYLLAEMGLSVEPLTRTEGARVVGLDNRRWHRLARDAMVACHVREDDILWTTNPADFLELGLTQDQVVALP